MIICKAERGRIVSYCIVWTICRILCPVFWVYLQQFAGGSNISNSRAPLWVVHMDFVGLLRFYLERPVDLFFAGSKVVLFIAAAVPFCLFCVSTLIDIDIAIRFSFIDSFMA